MTRKRSHLMIGIAICSLLFGIGACKSKTTPPTPTTPLTISCSASVTRGEQGLSVLFTCNASGGNGSYTYSWNFGDGQSSSQQNPTHVFNAIGNFVAKVNVTSGGDSASWSQTITVLLDRSVIVGSGGGSAEMTFNTVSSVRIRITLRGASNLVPYGYLEGPGYADYFPTQATSNNGVNSGELNLSQTGTFHLTVFEGNNTGGVISVKIEVI